MMFDAPPGAFGNLDFGKGGEEPCRRPSLPVGSVRHLDPHAADGGQAEFAQH